jgi:hypothetical protein
MRFRKLLASILVSCLPLVITLTYPKEWSKRWQRDLKSFFQRLERIWPGASLVWRLEFQKRRAPHFHCFLFGLYSKRERNDFKEWIAEAWADVVDSDEKAKHVQAGTSCEDIRTRAGAMSYAAGGYASKMSQTLPGEHVGRYWGVLGRSRLPLGKVIEFEIPRQAEKVIKRTFRRFQVAMKRKSQVGKLARKLKVSFAEVMNRRAAQELSNEKLFKMRLRNNGTVNLFCDVPQMARYVDWEIEKAERELNRHLERPF